MTTSNITHWVFGNGSSGCTYDHTGTADSKEDAIESALAVFDSIDDEAFDIEAELANARRNLEMHGIHYFSGPTGADYVEISEHAGPNPENEEAVFEAFQAELAEADRKVHVCDSFDAPVQFTVFAFGAYANTYVSVGHEPGLRGIEDCLESAAEKLSQVAPGMFVEPDVQAARDEILGSTGCGDDMLDDDAVMDHACADLTYTQSGYLPSYEWGLVSENMSREELLAFARGER